MAERVAQVGGVELCHETFGDAGGRPLLLVMGLGAPMIWWDEEFCETLAAQGFRVIRFDNRDAGTVEPDARPGQPRAGVPAAQRAVLAGGHGRRRRRAAGRAGHPGRARRRRVDGRDDRADAGDPAPGAGAVADVDHVQHRRPAGRPPERQGDVDAAQRAAAQPRGVRRDARPDVPADRLAGLPVRRDRACGSAPSARSTAASTRAARCASSRRSWPSATARRGCARCGCPRW